MGAAARELISRVRLAAEIPRKPVGDASIQPWELQYRQFESLSLRHVVSSAEKLLSFGPEICEKGRIFPTFCDANRTREIDCGAASLPLERFFSGAPIGSPRGNSRGILSAVFSGVSGSERSHGRVSLDARSQSIARRCHSAKDFEKRFERVLSRSV